jgi:hypothetical protein
MCTEPASHGGGDHVETSPNGRMIWHDHDDGAHPARGAIDPYEISDAEFAAAKADVIERYGKIPAPLQSTNLPGSGSPS